MNKKIMWLSAIALSISVSQATLACNCNVSAVSVDRFEQMTENLDLTDDQKIKVKAIGEKAREDMSPKFVELRKIRMHLNELASAKELEQSKIDPLIEQNKEVLGAIMKMRVTVRHDVDMILTEKQKAKLDDMVSDWKKSTQKKTNKVGVSST